MGLKRTYSASVSRVVVLFTITKVKFSVGACDDSAYITLSSSEPHMKYNQVNTTKIDSFGGGTKR
jgi:hypothetical protein